MKKILLILLLAITTAELNAQINWSNYSTSELGFVTVAIPYNGTYDNFERKEAGYSNWNPQEKLNIDSSIAEVSPLFFVYDTSKVYFLSPIVNKIFDNSYEYEVLVNNKKIITPWKKFTNFTNEAIGNMGVGVGMSDGYTPKLGNYLVFLLRNKTHQIITSTIIYYQKIKPKISFFASSNNANLFEKIASKNLTIEENNTHLNLKDTIKMSDKENNLWLQLDTKIYEKKALEYTLYKNGENINKWKTNDYNNNNIILKDLNPGFYNLQIRLSRQKAEILNINFLIEQPWYKTPIFLIGILLLLIILIILGILYFKYIQQKKLAKSIKTKAKKSENELDNLYALLNPHFTFNALNSIQGIINKGDIDKASQYLYSFGQLLRESLKESKLKEIPLEIELKNLQNYVQLEQLRTQFEYSIQIDPNINLFETNIPPFLLQPFVENAIKHGLSNTEIQGNISIIIKLKGEDIFIEINDNGYGFDTMNIEKGFGLELTQKRIALMNQEFKEELILLQINSSSNGTNILLIFKNWM
ncbi:sensor histidine kinase [Rhizosphaericola mali]|uniref:Signal transduction histidine kinase internal region domain-containing protein n=1 Tax=Rhizosphaericola mali TaxID=2545455 RepID=A0A5P2FW65_9BACT|nr:histidine kinase [Rhizosphaericola mali]QES87764.1 hypothetical protein E0W69_003470 [Rhizosphaericola mali]